MKRLLAVAVICTSLGLFLGFYLREGAPTALAAVGQGGVVEVCASKNGDVNADGKVNLTDAVTILGNLFQGSPEELVGLCTPSGLEACQAELATTRAALVSTQEKLAQCQQAKASALPDTGQNACYGLINQNTGEWGEVPCTQVTCPGQDGSYATGCPSEGRFVDNGNGTVTDMCTGLMWQKDTADVNEDGQSTEEDSIQWCNAMIYCENLSFAGHDDWRLPNIRELQSIVHYGRINPSIDPVFGAFKTNYWSSTSNVSDPGLGWYVVFGRGFVYAHGVGGPFYYIRAVRSGP